ncbi:hypothetical protein AF72_03705 [Xylella taiwanensis]|uniref:Uncharacterized protein n=1 Tax=Xylella taiwanensis TaxID=1444770 RepID=Z9JJU1_9GAMM|nr:hypothetical protein AF72_03705 [Xylella taiwanensis]
MRYSDDKGMVAVTTMQKNEKKKYCLNRLIDAKETCGFLIKDT